MNILVVEPGKRPYAKEISGDLESLQQTVGGYIQAIDPFDDPVALVCEEEALYHPEQKWNRPVPPYGVIKGTFFFAAWARRASPTCRRSWSRSTRSISSRHTTSCRVAAA